MRKRIMAKTNDRQAVNQWPHIRLDQIVYNDKPCIDQMDEETLDLLNTMCRDAESRNNWLHQINSTYRPNDIRGQHPLGQAVDIVFFLKTPGDVDVWEQYRFAKKYSWGGIGAYPFWKAGAGIHVDTRLGWDHVATWWRDAKLKDHGIAEARTIFGVTV